jgi:regulatory protein
MAPAPLEQAKALALRLLSERARTERQIRRRLEQAGLGAAADELIAWLHALGYLDDGAYAAARARALLAPGRLGPAAAEQRLVAAGVEPERARSAVAEALADGAVGGGPPEEALCRKLAERRWGGPLPRDLDPRSRARLARFLLGRGFSGDAVARLLGPGEDGNG